ncbi:D-alanyl-D-alanine carboxypeptidase [Patescibacteria group bacterium]|nr:D-alanyl-D-alanine carboxypeptidase [Patescibacteria group bacterium]
MKFIKKILIAALGSFILLPSFSFAASDNLLNIYNKRPDLQAAFDSGKFQAIEGSAAGFLIDLEDWARQYGWQEYAELSEYAPDVTPASSLGRATPEVTALRYIVIDDASGKILAARGAEQEWPIASITKLVTTKMALDHGLDTGGRGTVEDSDDVGGARLWVFGGTLFTISDILYATIVASANNAANAIARLSGMPRATFIDYMNHFADSLNLSHTRFVDPTGIELGNVSTAREVAAFAREVFRNENIRRMAGTWRTHIEALNDPDYVRDINSTNWLLFDPAYDDVYVTAGKTGYLNESGWNLVVRMHPMGDLETKSVLVVILGATSRRDSFDDAHRLAKWAWQNHDWAGRGVYISINPEASP